MQIDLWRVRLRLRKPFRHARTERRETVNLLARLGHGELAGWGEAVPRPYVTGESAEGALARARGLGAEVSGQLTEDDLSSPARAVEFVRAHVCPPTDDAGANAARAAVELAVLDAACRRCGEPLWRVAELVLAPEALREIAPVRYSAVISADDLGAIKRKALLYRLYGFRSVKLKVAAAGDDVERVTAARAVLGKRIDLRLDANNGWSLEEARRVLSELKALNISAVEEPLARGDENGLRELRERPGIRIILDESFATLADVDRIKQLGIADIINVRISKCGGLVRSLECIGRARSLGLGVQLGCMVGESSILSAAGRHIAQRVRDIIYLEGSYDRHLLADNLVRRDLTFARGGRAAPLSGAGLGIRVDEELVEKLAIKEGEEGSAKP